MVVGLPSFGSVLLFPVGELAVPPDMVPVGVCLGVWSEGVVGPVVWSVVPVPGPVVPWTVVVCPVVLWWVLVLVPCVSRLVCPLKCVSILLSVAVPLVACVPVMLA